MSISLLQRLIILIFFLSTAILAGCQPHTDSGIQIRNDDERFTRSLRSENRVSSSVGNEIIVLNVFGRQGAEQVSLQSDWNRILTVNILAPPANSQRGYFFKRNLTRVNISYHQYFNDAYEYNQVANRISATQGAAIVQLSTPGLFGSGGHVGWTYCIEGLVAINTAIDILKRELNAEMVVLAGHSTAGVMVANLLSKRSDISCAVISSAPLDLKAHEQYNSNHAHYFGANQPISPLNNIDQIAIDNGRLIYIGYSESDQIVDSSYQVYYADRLRDKGHNVVLEAALPADIYGHDIVEWRYLNTLNCARGVLEQ